MKRPWGKMWKIASGKKFWFKFLWVPGRTSLQAHRHRTEWHLGLYKVNPMEKHRLAHGAFFEFIRGRPDESDVIRYEDDYDRSSPEPKLVMVSGGFDPLHVGHVRMFKQAKALGDRLLVVLNSDEWLRRKKGRAFMPQEERAAIVKEIACVDEVYILESERADVIAAIERFRPHIFANGGDRKNEGDIPEAEICKELGIEMVFNVGGGKVQSSSWLLDAHSNEGNGGRKT